MRLTRRIAIAKCRKAGSNPVPEVGKVVSLLVSRKRRTLRFGDKAGYGGVQGRVKGNCTFAPAGRWSNNGQR